MSNREVRYAVLWGLCVGAASMICVFSVLVGTGLFDKCL